ncbi:MAG: hypothetical protein QXW23_07185 [Thermofilaceae archaeon]
MKAEVYGFEVSFSRVRVTPEKPVYLAGLARPRVSKGVHDDLYARCMLISLGNASLALVGVDSIGLQYCDVKVVKEKLLKRNIHAIVGSTHDHSSPDVIGLWGPDTETSGVDPEYVGFLRESIVECVEKAAEGLRRAKLEIVLARLPDGVAKNTRDPGLIDRDVVALFAEALDGERLGVLVNFGLHPEVLWSDNLLITADFPYYMLSKLEREYGGTGVFLNGALGGMVTPDVTEHSFAEAERVGASIAESVLKAAGARSTAYSSPSLTVVSREVELTVQNKAFLELAEKGVVRRADRRGDRIASVVNYFRITPLLEGVSLPGEPLPRLGLEVKSMLKAPFRMLVGLGDDEIGYLIPAEDWTEGRYEESMSLGYHAAPLLLGELKHLLELAGCTT